MKNHLVLDDIDGMTEAQRASIAPEEILLLQQELDQEKLLLDRHQYNLWLVFQARYADTFDGERESMAGVLHVSDDGYKITQEIGKRVKWNQKELSKVLRKKQEAGEDITDYASISYDVSENSYKRWPKVLQKEFDVARNVVTSRPKYSIGVGS